MKFAAIDIGTNAVRLLLSRVMVEDGGPPFFRKEALVRMPLRLGEDVFSVGKISDENVARLVESMVGFRHLIQAYPAIDYMAAATSAMREAENREEVVALVSERSGIHIEIIDGQREAEVIYANHIEERLQPGTNYLYVDVGGGSTEVVLLAGRRGVVAGSFQLGSVRILQGGVNKEAWREMKEWVVSNTAGYRPVVAIGSGGNINKIFKLARVKEDRPITRKQIAKIYDYVKAFEPEERITQLGLRPDRADVIIPAAKIYLSVMKWAKAKRMYVPQFGLSDGMVHVLYDRYRERLNVT
jgi:exopolyphosphatase/guanosine-5'-triphosphate,3'-diphosphate pyrophosphatase